MWVTPATLEGLSPQSKPLPPGWLGSGEHPSHLPLHGTELKSCS